MMARLRDRWTNKAARRLGLGAGPAMEAEALEGRRLLAGELLQGFRFGEIEEDDFGAAVAADRDGNVYHAGAFRGTIDVNPSLAGRTRLTSADDSTDIFLAKYNRAGRLLWARRFGGEGEDIPTALSVSPKGAVYLAGTFEDTVNFGAGRAPRTLRSNGDADVFVARFSPAGQLVWAGSLGGDMDDAIADIDASSEGNLFIAGSVRLRGDIDLSSRTRMIENRGVDDTFVQSVSVADGHTLWVRVYGENDTLEPVNALVADGRGGVYVGGTFNREVQFDRDNRAFTRESIHDSDLYLGHLRPNGAWDWITTAGGDDDDLMADIARGPQGDLFLTGSFTDTVRFGKTTLNAADDDEAFVARVNTRGQFVWARQFAQGDDARMRPRRITVDRNGNVYTAGEFTETVDFDPGPGSRNLVAEKDDAPILRGQREGTDAYIVKLDPAGRLLYAKQMGGEDGSMLVRDLATDAAGNVYMTGDFAGRVDLNPGSGRLIRQTDDEEEETDGWFVKLRP